MSTDLADFLLARITDDETAATLAMRPNQRHPWGDRTLPRIPVDRIPDEVRGYLGGSWGEHFARWDPVRVLTECAVKRRIVEDQAAAFAPGGDAVPMVLALLAFPYADHPDYRQEWAP